MKNFTILISFIVISLTTIGQNIELGSKTLKYLASDELKGRFPGSNGDSLSEKYLTSYLYKHWFNQFSFGYKQPFKLLTNMNIDSSSNVTIENNNLILNSDYTPLVFSATKNISGNIIYGDTSLKNKKIDFNNNIALIFLNNKKGIIPDYQELVDEVIYATDLKASGIIFVAKNNLSKNGELYQFRFSRSTATQSIPVIQITKKAFDKILKSKHLTIKDLNNKKIEKINKKLKQLTITINIKINNKYKETNNIVTYIEGTKSNKWIIIGAHYDHLGMGGYGSGSRKPELHEIHNGADDNASGASMVLMLADYYKNHQPETNMAFIFFSAEEEGLIGSKYFVKHMPFAKEKVKAMLNFDMVGRLRDSALTIIGINTAKEFKPILGKWQNKPLKLNLANGGFNGSDQASFLSVNIPVLFFNTGLHEEYHTPADDIETINFKGMQLISKLAVKIIDTLLSKKTNITNVKSNDKSNYRHKTAYKVTMGIMPDVTDSKTNGLKIDGIRPGGPADVAGLKKDDIIIMMNNKNVKTIYDYMHRLSELKKGDIAPITVLRNNKKLFIKVQF